MPTYEQILAALQGSGVPFAEVAWDPRPEAPYGVLSQDPDTGLFLDGARGETVHRYTADVFVRGLAQPFLTRFGAVFDGIRGLAWRVNSIQYEHDTKLTHIEWLLETAG